jgi:ribosome biogenesis protein BRX1
MSAYKRKLDQLGDAPAHGSDEEVDKEYAIAKAKREEEEFQREKARRQKIADRRVLVFSSRGLVSRFRHLMLDVRKLLPHHKKEVKFDQRNKLYEINEIAEIKGCKSCLFFECRKKKDLYLWMAKSPAGPSVKFHVQNIHTMEELKFTGNSLLGSRPILCFDKAFDSAPHLQMIKELFEQVFATPRGHPKSKPFVDHTLNFFIADGKIWFRHFQVVTDSEKVALRSAGKLVDAEKDDVAGAVAVSMSGNAEEGTELVEIGPRFCLDIVRMFGGAFGGPTLYQNFAYTNPNAVRRNMHEQKQRTYGNRIQQQAKRRKRVAENVLPEDELAGVFA